MTTLEIALVAGLWAAISSGFVVWLCPRLFQFTSEDKDE